MTNIYNCNDIREFTPICSDEDSNTVTTGADQFFMICFPNDRMKFKSKYRSNILTDLFKSCPNVLSRYSDNVKRYNVLKQKWTGQNYKVILEVGIYSVNKINVENNQIMSSYLFKDITGLILVKDCSPGSGFIISTSEDEQLHLFMANDMNTCQEILDRIRLISRRNIGVVIPINKSITYQQFQENKFGVPMSSIAIPIHVFHVYKIKLNNQDNEVNKKITLAFTENAILERDPTTNGIINVRFLTEIYAITRPEDHSQKFAILYLNGDSKIYTSTERDSLIASLLDSVRSSGRSNVSIRLDFNHNQVISQPEIEVARFINSRNKDIHQAMDFFIENNYFSSSVNIETKQKNIKDHEKCIHSAINELLFDEICDNKCEEFNSKLLVLKNLFSTKAGFSYFLLDRKYKSAEIEQLFIKVKKAFDKENDVVIFSSIDMLSTLMQVNFKITSH